MTSWAEPEGLRTQHKQATEKYRSRGPKTRTDEQVRESQFLYGMRERDFFGPNSTPIIFQVHMRSFDEKLQDPQACIL